MSTGGIPAHGQALKGSLKSRAASWRAELLLAGLFGLLTASLGLTSHSRVLLALGAAVAGIALLLAAPEITLAMFCSISAIKAAPWLGFLPVDATVLSALLVFAVAAFRFVRRGSIAFPPAILLVIALTALILASVYWSPAPSPGLSKAFRFEFLIVSALIVPLILIRERPEFARLMFGFMIFGLIVGATAKHTGDAGKPLTVAGGNISEEFDLATQCALGAVGALYFIIRGPVVARWCAVPVAGFLGYIVFAAASRGVMIGFGLACVYVLCVLTGRVVRPWVTAAIVVGVMGVVIASVSLAGQAATRYGTGLSLNATTTLGPRGFIYHDAEQMALNYPFGHGSGAFPIVTTLGVYPHNIELELADEYGLPAVALLLVLVVAAWRARRVAWRNGWVIESAIVGALLILLLFDAQLSHDITSSRPLWLIFGLALALARLEPETRVALCSRTRSRTPLWRPGRRTAGVR